MAAIGRRLFFKITAALAALGGSWAGLRAAFTARGAVDEWVTLGMLSTLPEGVPELRTVTVTERLWWLDRTVEKEVWIQRTAGGVHVLTATCPHEACTVQQAADSAGFICLCHRSRFATDGAVLDGPALRGMDWLEHRIEGGIVAARFRKFRKQTREKVVIS